MKTKITTLILVMFFVLMFCGVVSAADAQNTTKLNQSTYLGGNSTEGGSAIAVDSHGNVYVTGGTGSTDFPTTNGTYKSNTTGGGDIFVSKFNSKGKLIFSTYFGGSGSESGSGIAVDSQGNVYITGTTKSTDFPTTSGAYQTSLNGISDAFLVKLSSDGSTLLYSTYFGGNSTTPGGAKAETAEGIAVDSQGNVYITGKTDSLDFPTTSGAYKTEITRDSGGNLFTDTYVTKFNSNGELIYSTLIGGCTSDETPYGIKVDSQGNIWVAGKTVSSDYPTTTGAYQPAPASQYSEGFISKISPKGNGNADLIYSTYLGGTGNDYIYALALDRQDNVYVTGQTTSTNFPTTNGVYQKSRNGSTDTFVAKFDSNGGLAYSTYFGGSGLEDARAIAVDNQGNAYITGYASKIIPITAGAVQTGHNGGSMPFTADAYLSKLNSDGTKLLYSTLLGGNGNDNGHGLAVDSQGNAYITGTTTSSINFPLQGAIQTERQGTQDAFVAKIATAPTVNINQTGGLFNKTQSITLTTSDSTDTIYYTTDGSDPQTSGTRSTYAGPLSITDTTTLRYIAVDSLGNWSPIYNETYTIDKTAPLPKADLQGGSYNTTQTVKLSATDNLDSNPKIYYTLDGSTPTTSSKLYDGPINIANTATLKFIAVDEAGNQSPVQSETYNIKSDVYVNITSSKPNPQVGDKVTYTFKLGNNGPGIAKDVVFTYVIPEGVEFDDASVDQGEWTYDEATRTLTWKLGDVEVGDPYLWLDLNILNAESFNIQPTVSVAGYNPELESNIGSLFVNAVSASNTEDPEDENTQNNNTTTVNAATKTTTNTIPMQDTGLPLTGLTMALLLVGSGLALARKK